MEKKRKKILIDVDDVIVDNVFLDAINNFKGTKYKDSDFESYYIDKEIMDKKELEQFDKFILENDMYERCRIIDGAEQALNILKDHMDIYICSACVVKRLEKYSGIFFARKYNFLIKQFPYIDPNKIIFTSSKNNFVGFDYQIDDRVENLMGDIKHKLLFTRYHNIKIESDALRKNNIIRVEDWSEILDYIMCM